MKSLKADPRSLTERVEEAIKAYIIEHGLREGDRLPSEYRMAELLGVSRASVREAIATLAAVGIVEVKVGKGAFVRDFSFQTLAAQLPYGLQLHSEDLHELIEIRRLLEVYAVRKITPIFTDQQLVSLRAILECMAAKAEAGEDFIAEDVDFHRFIATAAGRRVLAFLLDAFWQIQRTLRQVETDPDKLRDRCREHWRIYEAMAARDVAAAVEEMEGHFERLEKRLAAAS